MLFDSIKLAEGAEFQNLVVATGAAFPTDPDVGELFYLTGAGVDGLYVYVNAWTRIVIAGDSISALMPNVVTANTYGNATNTASIGVSAKGLITSVTNTPIAIPATAVTSGTFASARIAAASVTQHQAALSIAETQIPDGTLLTRNAGTETITGTWTFNNATHTGAPTAATHAATKQYVDNVAQGITSKPAAEIATTANLPATYDNGVNGVGATLTGTGAFPAIDGVTLTSTVTGQNGVLVKNQTVLAHNGRYNLTSNAPNWVLTRCGLCDEIDEIPGSYVFVKRGTINGGTGWIQITDTASFVVGSNIINVIQFSGAGTYTANTGLTLTGTQFALANVGTPGTYRSVTTNAQGQITAGTNPTTLAGYGITDAQPKDADLTSIAGLVGTTGLLRKTAADTWSLDTVAYLTNNQSISITGDATGSGANTIALTLSNVGTAGTYKSVTVDTKGRVTGGTNPTTIAGYGITDAPLKDGTGASGSWGINIVGNAATATHAGTADILKTSRAINNALFSGGNDIYIYDTKMKDNRILSPNLIQAGFMSSFFTSWANNATAEYADALLLRGYTDASGGADNLVMFKRNGLGLRLWQQAYGSATPFSYYKDVAWTDGSNATGQWPINISGVAYGSSTIRIKENIRPLENNVAAIMDFNPVVYDLKDGSMQNQIGLIAEEVQSMFPCLVNTDEEGLAAGIDYARIVALLIGAVKEQEARIKILEARG